MSTSARAKGQNAKLKSRAKPEAGKAKRRSSAARGQRPSSTKRKKKASPSKTPRWLPLSAVWLLAVISLASLIHWGMQSAKSPTRRGPNEVASAPSSTPARRAGHNVAPAEPAPTRAAQRKSGSHPTEAEPPAQVASVVPRPLEGPQPPPLPQPPLGRVAIVIDDFGPDLQIAREFIRLPFPVTFSVLPHLQHSRDISELVHREGHEVILHLPMEPKGYPTINPGPGALLVAMSDSEIDRVMNRDLDSNPYAVGVNNHMGSRFTENREKMQLVIRELQRRHLFFLDSYTTAHSTGLTLAEESGLPTRRRDIFLDNEQTPQSIIHQLHQLIRHAKIYGSAIAIGHPHAVTLSTIRDNANLFEKERIQLVKLSDLMN
jgi:polysaccharide deacetylase 2 family uncharacterized protein YibQ